MFRQLRPICWNENMPVHAPPLDCSGDCFRYPNGACNFLSKINLSVNRAAVQCLAIAVSFKNVCFSNRPVWVKHHQCSPRQMMGWMAPLRHLSAKLLSDRNSSEWEPSMGEVTTIGLDLAKHVFQVHGVDAEGA